MSVNFGPNVISTMLLITICQKPHFGYCLVDYCSNKNDPRFHSHTLFPKRNATFKKIAELALAAMGFQLFRQSRGKMCTQTIEYPGKTA